MDGIAIVERARVAISLGESHFREFKSALEGRPGEKIKRATKDIATNISQTLVAFANADGGELLVGVEDNGEITGLNEFTESELLQLEQSPVSRVHQDTPLPTVKKFRLKIDGYVVLYFSVPKSSKYVHVTSDGRCLQRSDLESVPVSAEAIQFDRKEEASREYDRQFIDGASADALDLELVRAVADQIIKGMSPEKCLQYLELAEYGMAQLRLRKAALLLFSKEPTKWHPRIQIRIIKVDGNELKTGEEYNVISDESVSGNILSLVDRSWEALRPHLTQTKFDASARFTQKSIYPEMACKEALLNSIAHRDYSDEGRGIEVYIYNDFLEIKNPGCLLSSISIKDIENQTGAHQSRNTYVARVLRELGYMRELGEGMRRIYDLMHKNELEPPKLTNSSTGFSIVLTHKPVYSDKDLLWLGQFDFIELDREKKAIILLGQDEKIFSAQDIWDAVGIVDTEHYRTLVDFLIKNGILTSKIERSKAQQLARKKKIPFRQFPRYQIKIPKQSAVEFSRSGSISKSTTSVDDQDLRGNSCNIYVSNIPFSASDEEVYDALILCGDIAELKIPRINGKTKGYCFVEYESRISGAKALENDGKLVLGNRSLRLRIANRHASEPQSGKGVRK